jgi:FlaA1/EpsC-like NDP-sugar epimerase
MTAIRQPNLSRNQRYGILLIVYAIVLVGATSLAYGLRFDFVVPIEHQRTVQQVWIWVWPIKLIALALTGQFSSLLSFFSIPDLKRLSVGLGAVTVGLLIVWSFIDGVYEMSRAAILLDGIVAILGISMTRLAFRLIRQGTSSTGGANLKRIGIVGAGAAGAALAREFQIEGGMQPVAFYDDVTRKHGTQVHGVPVVGSVEVLQNGEEPPVDEIVIAMPSAPGERVREITNLIQNLKIRCHTVPALSQLAQGQVVTALRPVDINDVLGREAVDLNTNELVGFFMGKTVLVTGAGGSIGSELCRQLANLNLNRLILIDRSEAHLFEIHAEVARKAKSVPLLLDVLDKDVFKELLQEYQPEVIFHAAAFKHVALLEDQPAMAVRNNVWATHLLASLAGENGVEFFVHISTDKAVDPSSVMGASKRLAERLIEGHAFASEGVHFISVRFGNVLGSSGSVVPIFQKQIEEGGPVTVRGETVSRFFMSIPEAAGLVITSAALGVNGDQFILDMGQPVRIADLAEQMIRLSGKTPGKEIAIEFSELLPGEKVHEALNSADEELTDTPHPKIKRIERANVQDLEWDILLSELEEAREQGDDCALRILMKFVPGFRSK